jgi:protein phosphatase
MGGHSAGEIASRLAIEAIEGFVRRSAEEMEFSWPYGIDPVLSYDGNRLRTAIRLANRRVFRAAESQDDYTGMGTTVVSALISDGRLCIGHVGDSRLYMFVNGSLSRMTEDDSWAATVLAQDRSDSKALAAHPMRNVLTNVLGAREQTEVHLLETPLSGGETLLLCSDGLHTAVGDDTVKEVLASGGEPRAMAGALIDTALARGARDNVTAVVVAYSHD